MKQTIVNNLLVFFAISFLISCSNNNDPLLKLFNQEQLETIDKMIDFYDSSVLQKTESDKSIGDAYIEMLDKHCPLILNGDESLDVLMPDTSLCKSFYESLNIDHLNEFFYLSDSVLIYDRETKQKVFVYRPNTKSFNYKGQYMTFLSKLSNRNWFFLEYYNEAHGMGDIAPTNHALILRSYSEIDFNRKEERLVFIINMLYFY